MQPQGQVYGQPYAPPPQGNGIAVAGMVLGIVGLLLFWVPGLGSLLNLLGLIFSALGISRAGKISGSPGKGMAIAGLVCAIIGFLGSAWFIWAIFMVGGAIESMPIQ